MKYLKIGGHSNRLLSALFFAAIVSSSSSITSANDTGATGDDWSTLSKNGMTLRWRHADDRFYAELFAPTDGWLAVGFNERATLAGTRFVIGHIKGGEPYAEVHLAQPPQHRNVQELGGQPDLQLIDGDIKNGVSRIQFSLPQQGTAPYALNLAPGQTIHLMLAWSQDPDFTHHSAMRVHLPLAL